jgi:deazaflavin-dependent oxidoreductase (nitroreductase family)
MLRFEHPRSGAMTTVFASRGGAVVRRRNRGRRERVMPLPRLLARVNKRVFNPLEMRRGVEPVLIHVGRSSGKTYRTPLDAHPLQDGYLFIPMYGPRTDWLKNVIAAGAARLSIGGTEIELESPRLVRKGEVWPLLAAATKTPWGISDESELLRMDVRRAA